MYIPDLFGAYVKGRELAIAKNWEDLANYEKIEDARNDNDLKAMDIWERRQQMPGKMNMFYNNVGISQMNTDVAREAHPGLIADARTGSLFAQDKHAVFLKHRDYGRNVMDGLYRANLGMLDAAGRNKQGQADHWLTDNNAYNFGVNASKIAQNTQAGELITSQNASNVAQQKISESNAAHGMNMGNYAYQTDYIFGRHEQLPEELKLQGLHTKNDIYTAEGFIPNQKADKTAKRDQQLLGLFQEQSSLYDKLSTVTDPATRQVLLSQIAHLQDYMYGMGYTPDTTIPSGAGVSSQATPATGQTQSSVPVGTNSVLAPTGTPQTNQPVQGIRSLLPPMFQNPNDGQVYSFPVSPEYGSYNPTAPQIPTPNYTPVDTSGISPTALAAAKASGVSSNQRALADIAAQRAVINARPILPTPSYTGVPTNTNGGLAYLTNRY